MWASTDVKNNGDCVEFVDFFYYNRAISEVYIK